MRSKTKATGGALILFLILWIAGSWLWNVTQLVSCDWKLPYKCEAVHTLGVVLWPAAVITVWFTEDR